MISAPNYYGQLRQADAQTTAVSQVLAYANIARRPEISGALVEIAQ
jgi:hypothetical protein